MQDLAGDIRYAFRTLVRQPGFTLVAALSLALGIGLNTTIFSVVNAILLKKLPIEDPGRLVEIYSSPSEEFPHLTSSYPDFLDIRKETEAFEGLTAHAMVRGIVTTEGRSDVVTGEVVTANYFEVLGVRPVLGRGFHSEEDATEGTHPVMVLSHGLWQRRLGGDPDVVGKSLRLSGVDYNIIGVAPETYTGTIPGIRPEYWVPTAMVENLTFNGIQSNSFDEPGKTRRERRGTRWLFVKGRLAPGASVEEAQAQVSTVFARLTQEYPDTNEDMKAARKRHALAENHGQHVRGVGPERHAKADFVGAAADRISDDAVEADRGKKQCEAAKRTEKARAETRRHERDLDDTESPGPC